MRPRILVSVIPLIASFSLGCDLIYSEEPEANEMEQSSEELELDPQPLPLEDTPTAYAMLRVVNESGFAQLDREVGLDSRAARSILELRAGSDDYVWTEDDRYVGTIAQLNELYWLGEANLWAIQRYALLEGYAVDELPEGECPLVLTLAIDECLDHAAQAAGAESPDMDELLPSCLVQSDERFPSTGYFTDAGVTGYTDPWLGYHALLCSSENALAPCRLGVAGMAAHYGPHCDALYDGG